MLILGKIWKRLEVELEEGRCCSIWELEKDVGMEILLLKFKYDDDCFLLLFMEGEGEVLVIIFVKFLVYLWIVFLLFVIGCGCCCKNLGLLLKLYDVCLEL